MWPQQKEKKISFKTTISIFFFKKTAVINNLSKRET